MYPLFSSHLHPVSQRWFAGYSKSLFKLWQTSILLRIQWLVILMPRQNGAVFEEAEEWQLRYLRLEFLWKGHSTPTCSTNRVQQRTEGQNKCVIIPIIRTPKIPSWFLIVRKVLKRQQRAQVEQRRLTEIHHRLSANIKATWYFHLPSPREVINAVSPVMTL